MINKTIFNKFLIFFSGHRTKVNISVAQRGIIMSIIYIVSSGGKLCKEGETLVLHSPECRTTIFPFKTEQLVFLGGVEITGQALSLIMRYKIDTVFLNRNGRFNGRLSFGDSKNVYLRLKQYRLLENEEFKLKFAKSIVSGKIRNQILFMQRINRKKENNSQIFEAIQKTKQILDSIERAENIEQIRGYEGMAAKYYFSVFRYAINQDWAIFNGRSKNPPEDNVNAVLSFLYTLLFYRVESAIEVEGLDPFAGFFHSVDYGKKTLAFDLMEEFRTPIVDTTTVALFNLGILNPEDFEEKIFSKKDEEYPLEEDSENVAIEEKKGVLLTKEGIKKVISHFEKKLDTEIFYQPLGQTITYKRVIREQANHFHRVVNSEKIEYNPMIVR